MLFFFFGYKCYKHTHGGWPWGRGKGKGKGNRFPWLEPRRGAGKFTHFSIMLAPYVSGFKCSWLMEIVSNIYIFGILDCLLLVCTILDAIGGFEHVHKTKIHWFCISTCGLGRTLMNYLLFASSVWIAGGHSIYWWIRCHVPLERGNKYIRNLMCTFAICILLIIVKSYYLIVENLYIFVVNFRLWYKIQLTLNSNERTKELCEKTYWGKFTWIFFSSSILQMRTIVIESRKLQRSI